MKKNALSFLMVCILVLALAGCGQSGSISGSDIISSAMEALSEADTASGTESAEESSKEEKPAVIDNRSSASESNPASSGTNDNREQPAAEVKPEDFEVKSYLYKTIFDDTLYFMVVKNNSQAKVEIDLSGQAKDANGNMIGAADTSIDVLGPGEESIGYFYFNGVSGIASVDYQLDYNTLTYYYPVLSNLTVEQTLNDSNVVLTVTNSGDTDALFVEAYGLFMDADNNVINYSSTYLTDKDGMIKPGKTISGQLDCYDAYDHVEVYLTGRSDGSSSAASDSVSADEFEVREMTFENVIGNTMHFLIIKNNSAEIVAVNGNATALDPDNNVLSAADFSIDVLGPGEESIGYFYFDSDKSIDHVEYELDYSTDLYYTPVLSDLQVEQTINNNNVIVSVTNNGTEAAEFVEAYALFLDSEGNIVAYDNTYLVDDDSEIKPGKTIVKQLDAYEAFDTVEVYLTGRHSNW